MANRDLKINKEEMFKAYMEATAAHEKESGAIVENTEVTRRNTKATDENTTAKKKNVDAVEKKTKKNKEEKVTMEDILKTVKEYNKTLDKQSKYYEKKITTLKEQVKQQKELTKQEQEKTKQATKDLNAQIRKYEELADAKKKSSGEKGESGSGIYLGEKIADASQIEPLSRVLNMDTMQSMEKFKVNGMRIFKSIQNEITETIEDFSLLDKEIDRTRDLLEEASNYKFNTGEENKKFADTQVEVSKLVKEIEELKKEYIELSSAEEVDGIDDILDEIVKKTGELIEKNTDLGAQVEKMKDAPLSLDEVKKQLEEVGLKWENFTEVTTKSTDKFGNAVKQYQDKFGNLVTLTEKMTDSGISYSMNLKSEYKGLYAEADKLIKKVNDLDRGLDRMRESSDTQKAKILKAEFDEAAKSVEKLKNQITLASKSEDKNEKEVAELTQQLRQQIDVLNKLGDSYKEVNAQIRNQGGWMLNLRDSFVKAFRSFTTYMSVTNVFYQTAAAIRGMVNEVKELDEVLTEFKKVSDLAGGSLDNYVKKAGELGTEVAKTTSEMIDAATEFKKSGYGDQESLKLGQIANMYTNIADESLSAADAASFIIAQMKAFKIEANDAIHVVDALNEVSNNYAVSSAQLAGAIGKVSATMEAGDTSYEQTLGLITAVTEVTRNADKAANALKTIGQRIRGVGEDGEDASEYVASLQAEFDKLGIATKIVKNSAGEMESTYNILKAMAEKWGDLTDAQRQSLGEIAAGKNRITELNALMLNWNTAVEATNTALNSNGSAMKENAKVLDSIEGHLQKLRAEWQKLATSILDSNILKLIADFGTGTLKFLQSGLGKFITLTGALTSALIVLKRVVQLLTKELKKSGIEATTLYRVFVSLKQGQAGLEKNLAKTIVGFKDLSKAEKKAVIEAEKVKIANAKLNLGIFAVSTAISLVVSIWKAHNEAVEAARDKLIETAETFEDNKKNIDGYVESIKEYKKTLSDLTSTTSQKEDATKSLEEIEYKLYETYGKQAENIDLVNGNLEDQIKLVKELSATEADKFFTDTSTIKKARSKVSFSGNVTPASTTISTPSSKLGEFIQNVANEGGYDVRKTTRETRKDVKGGTATYAYTAAGQYEDIIKYYEELSKQLQHHRQALIDDGVSEAEYNRILDRVGEEISSLTDKYDSYNNVLIKAKEMLWQTTEGQNAFYEFLEAAKDGLKDEEIDELLKKYPELATRVDIVGLSYDDLREKFEENIKTEEKQKEIAASKIEAFDALTNKIKNISDSYNTLKGIIQDYNQEGYITADSLKTILDNWDTYGKYLDINNGKLSLNTELIKANYNAELDQAEATAYDNALKELQNLENGKIVSSENNVQKSLAESKKAYNDYTEAIANNTIQKALNADDVAKVQTNLNKQLALIKKARLSLGKSSSSASSSASKGTAKWEKELNNLNNSYKNNEITVEQYITKLEALAKKYKKNKTAVKELTQAIRDAKLEKLEDDYKRGLIGVEEYIEGLKELQKAYKESTKEWNEFADKIKSALDTILKNRQSKYKNAQQAAINLLDEELDRLEKLKDETEDYYDKLIEEKEKANEATEKEIELTKLQEALENARNNKTKRVFVQGLGWQYVADEEAIKEAQDALDEFQREEEINALEAEKDVAVKAIEEQITALNAYKDSWSDITDAYENEQNRLILAEVAGADAESQILNQRLEVLEKFRDEYITILRDLDLMDNITADTISQEGITLNSGGSFASGGVVDYTGYAKVHGSASRPEIMLNNSQAASLYSMLKQPQVISKQFGGASTQVYNFDKLVLPNVSNARQFINELKTITNITKHQ